MARSGMALAVLTALATVGITGALLRDALVGTARHLTGGGPIAMTAAGWVTVTAASGLLAACLWGADRTRPGATAHRIALLVVAGAAAPVPLWFFPVGQDRDPFFAGVPGETDMVTGGQAAWLAGTLCLGVVLAVRRLRRTPPEPGRTTPVVPAAPNHP